MTAKDGNSWISSVREYEEISLSFPSFPRVSENWLNTSLWLHFRFILWKDDLNNYQCVLISKADDGLPLIFVLQKTMAAMGHDDPSMPLDFKFPFQNKSILIKLNLINKMTNQLGQQMKSNMQVKAWINLDTEINLKCKHWLNLYVKFKCGLKLRRWFKLNLATMGHHTSPVAASETTTAKFFLF